MLDVRLLGPLAVHCDDQPVIVTAPLQRTVLAALAVTPGHALTVDQIVDALWHRPPDGAVNVVQQYISALRRRLGPEVIVTVSRSYRLQVDPDAIDVERFRALSQQAEQQRRTSSVTAAARLLRDALDLWRGAALADLPAGPFVDTARGTLGRERLETQIAWLSVENDLGNGARVVAQAESLAATHPFDESVAAVLMRCLAEAGRQRDALAVYQSVRARLLDELGVDPGEILQAMHAAVLRHDQSVIVSARDTRGNSEIPRPSTVLVGRETDLFALDDVLAGQARLITLVGPGGVGKTRLAVEVARRVAANREVIYVPLATVTAAGFVLQAVAAALRVRPTSETDLLTQIASALEGRDVLIVLDNFEHVIGAAADVAGVLARTDAPSQILVTSRESLRIGGEQVVVVRPLATEQDATRSIAPAVQLFWQRAEASNPAFNREAEPSAVVEICKQLDGLPLGIELAASRTSVLSPVRMLDRLSNRLGLLTAGSRDSPDRQKSLRACVAWSVDLLDGPEQRVFAAASVFDGGATLPALEDVLAPALPDVDVLAAVESLVAKSLMASSPGAEGTRLTMLETIREYAKEQLDLSGFRDDLERVHALWFHRRYGSGADALGWPPRTVLEAAAWYEDLPNARAAMSTFVTLGEFETYADLVVALCPLWRLRSLWHERHTHLAHITHHPQVSQHRRIDALILRSRGGQAVATAKGDALLAEANRLLASEPAPDPVQECVAALMLAYDADLRGDDGAVSYQAARAREAADRSNHAEVKAEAAAFGSLRELEDALMSVRQSGNQFSERGILINLSELALESPDDADLERAHRWGREAYDLGTLIGDGHGAAMGLANSATAWLLLRGPADQISSDLRQAITAVRHAGDTVIQIENLLRLAANEAALGHDDLSRVLVDAWRGLSASHGLGVSPSNQRVIDTFLSGADRIDCPQPSIRAQGSVELSTAVEIALGERALGSIHDVRRRA